MSLFISYKCVVSVMFGDPEDGALFLVWCSAAPSTFVANLSMSCDPVGLRHYTPTLRQK